MLQNYIKYPTSPKSRLQVFLQCWELYEATGMSFRRIGLCCLFRVPKALACEPHLLFDDEHCVVVVLF